MSDEFNDLKRLEVELHCLRCDLITKGDPFINNNIRLVEDEIARVEAGIKGVEESTNEEAVNMLEECRNYEPVDIWIVTVKKYYGMVKYHTKKNRKQVSLANKAA